MRAALLIAGQPRTMEFCYPSLKRHILDVYQPDVFISTDSQKARMLELFNPISISVRPQLQIHKLAARLRQPYLSKDGFETMVAKDLSIAWKVWRAAALKRAYEIQRGAAYDVVILTRFDVKFHCVPEIKTPAENTIHLPRKGAYWITPPDAPGIHWHGHSAHLCWMPSRIADLLSGMYFEGEDIFKLACESAAFGYIPEYVFKFFLDRNHIAVEFFDAEMMLIRGTSEAPLSFHNLSLADYPDYL